MHNILLTSSLLTKEITDELERFSIKCRKIGKYQGINNETAYHPDMLFYVLADGNILYPKGLNVSHLLDTNRTYIESTEKITAVYPYDCRLNCLKTDKTLICGKLPMPEILCDAEKAGLEIITVKQSYVRCSTVTLNRQAFITSDTGIASALKALGCDVLNVSNDGIILNGYDNGFIGGCLMFCDGSLAAFSGRIEAHRDYAAMKAFSQNHGIKLYSLCANRLYDYGGAISL